MFDLLSENGIPRRLNMNMHESHNLPARPIFSPIEWSNLKIEQDRTKMDLARRIQYQNQQEAALQQQRLQQQQLVRLSSELSFGMPG